MTFEEVLDLYLSYAVPELEHAVANGLPQTRRAQVFTTHCPRAPWRFITWEAAKAFAAHFEIHVLEIADGPTRIDWGAS